MRFARRIFRAFLFATLAVLLPMQTRAAAAQHGNSAAFVDAAGERFFAVTITDPVSPEAHAAIDLALVVDLSASQSGERRQVTVQLATDLVEALRGGSRVQVWLAQRPQQPLLQGPAAVGSDSLKQAIQTLGKEVPGSATDLPAVFAGLRQWLGDRSGSLPKVILSIGDGNSSLIPVTITETKRLVETLREHEVPWSAVRVGGAGVDTCSTLAMQTGGRVFRVRAGTEPQVPDIVRSLTVPVFYPETMTTSAGVEFALPLVLPPLRSDQGTLLVGKSPPDANVVLEIKGKCRGESMVRSIELKIPSPSGENCYLASMYQSWKANPKLIPVGDPMQILSDARNRQAIYWEQLLFAAEQAIHSRDLENAERLYERVAATLPEDPAAKLGLRAIARLKQTQGKDTLSKPSPRPPVTEDPIPPADKKDSPTTDVTRDPIEDAKAKDRIEAQRLHRVVRDALTEAQRLARTDPASALRLLKQTLTTLDSYEDLSAANHLRRRVEQELRTISRQNQRVQMERLERDQALARFEGQRRQDRAELTRQQQTKALMDRYRSLWEQGSNAEAERVADQVVANDAGSLPGHAAQWQARLARHYGDANQVEVAKQEGWWRALTSVDQSAIPFDDRTPLVYPPADFWEEITIKREKYKSVDLSPESPAEEEIRASLARPITFNFVETPLRDVIAFLKDYAGVNVVLDTTALDEVGVDLDIPVTLTLESVSLRSALRILLRPLELTYLVKDEVLLITTYNVAESELITKVYPVGDLVIPIGNFSNGGGVGMLGSGGNQGGGIGQGQGAPGGFNNGGLGVRGNQGNNANNNQDPDNPSPRPPRPNANQVEALQQIIESAAGDWEAFIEKGKPEPQLLKQLLATLTNQGKHAQARELLQASIRQRDSAAWVFEALVLSLRLEGAEQVDINTALLSLIDLAPGSLDLRRRIAAELSSMGQTKEALALLEATAALEPSSAKTYLQAMQLAEAAEDIDRLAWSADRLLSRQWVRSNPEIQSLARGALRRMETRLRAAGDITKADRLAAVASTNHTADLEITVTWQGEADIDLCVVEPGDLLCSPALPQTIQGGVLLSDQEPNTERYIAREAFDGDYEILLRPIWGEPTGGVVHVDVVKHGGTDKEVKERHSVRVGGLSENIVAHLKNGRRKAASPLAPVEEVALAPETVPSPKAQLRQMLGEGAQVKDDPFHVPIDQPITTSGAFAQQIPFVTGGVGVASGGAVAFEPEITVISNGTTLTAQAIVSADRRYVRMTLIPTIQNVQSLDQVRTVQVTGVTGGSVISTDQDP